MHAVLTRRQPVPPTGVPMTWRTALERFAHGVHRYHDRVEVVPDRALRRELQEAGAVLDRCLGTARAVDRVHDDAQKPDAAQAVRDMLRAGTLCSHALEAAVAATTARRAGDDVEVARSVSAVRALAALVEELVEGCAVRPPERRRFRPS